MQPNAQQAKLAHPDFSGRNLLSSVPIGEFELYLTYMYKASLGACRRAMPMAYRALPRMPILVYVIVVL